MYRSVLFVLVIGGLTAAPMAKSQPRCTFVPLSYAQAKRLVMMVPDVIGSQKWSGHKMVISNSGPVFPKNSKWHHWFYAFEVNALGGGGADGGLVGHYAVNKMTAQVIDFGTLTTVKGVVLGKAQAKLRATHCINQAIIVEDSIDWHKQ